MNPFTRTLFPRMEPEVAPGEALELGELVGDVPDMKPAWTEASNIFHSRDRCARYLAIAPENLRHSKIPPAGRMLCGFCRQIVLSGRKG